MSGYPVAERVIGRIAAPAPGASVVVGAGIHGNEPAGIHAAERVLAALSSGAVDVRGGELVVLAGNVAALRRGERYLARDMNRGWTDARLARLRRGDAQDAEDREQMELLAALDAVAGRARGPVHLADLHTSSAAGVPFVLFRASEEQRAFVSAFPIPVISGIVEQVEGVLSEHACARGFIAFSVEGGQHDAPESCDSLEAILWITLRRAGIVGACDEVDNAERVLRSMRGDLPGAVEVIARHAITQEDAFVMERGFRNIDRVKKGDLLAHDRSGEVRAHEDGVVVLPLYQKLGNDGFFWGREVVDVSRSAPGSSR